MNELCNIIKETVRPNFLNIRTSIQTYDRDAICVGAPCWRWVYHALHSADKWFFNPYAYTERPGFETGSDNPFKPISHEWSDEELLALLESVRQKTMDYLANLTDSALNECPPECPFTRLELILMQFRHLSVHIGMLHGLTVEKTGRFPQYVSPHSLDRLKNGWWDD